MKLIDTNLPGVCVIEPKVLCDPRGFFVEFYNQRVFADLGIDYTFVQDNHSRSSRAVVRGLHYQLHHPQAKLIRVIVGEVYDVALDVRQGSPTFGQWTGAVVSAANMRMLLIPEGFAHGFCVVSETAEVTYKCSDFYVPEDEQGIIWNDPDLAIPWPLGSAEPIVSPKDAAYGTLATRPGKDLPLWKAGRS